ncbi:MAG: HAMP domain-containing sensor histidine kinase, partial [Gemmatimonadaceae bacterium]
HEFRSPLTGIRQLGEMLMRGRVPNEARRQEYYERITRESDRLARLVENLLDFARMEEGRRDYRFEPLDAVSWLRQAVADFESQRADSRVTVVAAIPDTLPPVVGDREALTCAVDNLLDNAIKYSPGCETIWLQAEASNSHMTISVRDEGVGIDDGDRKRVFDRFYRGHGDITRAVKGAGLGLSLVRHIIHAHGGKVWCESRPGAGTTFIICLRSGDRVIGPADRRSEV